MFRLLSRPPLIVYSFNSAISKSVEKVTVTVIRYKMSDAEVNNVNVKSVEQLIKRLAPPLSNDKHKGQAGRIGVFGGSLEYTGAPYFAAISALKVGADLSHVFCSRDAAPVIKSYSPELIVHPLLDDSAAAAKIEPWLDRLHVVVIGPGLGREPSTFTVITDVINLCKARSKPLVIDADGLFYITENSKILKDYPAPVLLTPNSMEFTRLVAAEDATKLLSSNKRKKASNLFALSKNITVLCKGHQDEIFNDKSWIAVDQGGSGRRCGGQGDLLSGASAVFLAWTLDKPAEAAWQIGGSDDDNRALAAAYAAAKLARGCNAAAFAKKGRSMTCTDMIEEIHGVFEEHFELK